MYKNHIKIPHKTLQLQYHPVTLRSDYETNRHIDRLSDKNFRFLRECANQIAGRKQRRKTAFNFRVPDSMKRRARQNAFKDIAGATRTELRDWIKEDAHHHVEGGSLAEAFQKTPLGSSVKKISPRRHILKKRLFTSFF